MYVNEMSIGSLTIQTLNTGRIAIQGTYMKASKIRELDSFTQRRLANFISDFRKQSGQLPTLKDLETADFDRVLIEIAVKKKVLEQFYSTLTNGSIVKTYKVFTSS